MELPKYYELYLPFLNAVNDEKIHTLRDIKEHITKALDLKENEISKRLPSGSQTIYDNRIGWARAYLKKAGLIISPQRAQFQITNEGKKLLKSGAEITDNLLAEKYPEFADFIKGGRKTVEKTSESSEQNTIETPQETFERVYKAINKQLADDLLTEIMNQTPVFFENLVVDLMKSMGYGEGLVTKTSGDNGIDGIMHEDRLGFNLIYIQAKRWDTCTTINKPEIQKFAGAMMGPPKIEKGVFITTAKFSQGAKDFADAQHIILIDGERLSELMIENDIGVSTQKNYSIKRIDSDYLRACSSSTNLRIKLTSSVKKKLFSPNGRKKEEKANA